MQPRPYQLAGRDFLASRRHALLADEMRVGKTPQAILAAHKLGAKSVLVVCPAIAVGHWKREFEKWWPSGPLPRLAVWSYDRARAIWQDGRKGAVDVFIPDEAHFARNPEAARTKMVYGKTGFGTMAGAVWALSGTPAPKHAAELWCMMRAFGIVGTTYNQFVSHYCTVDWQGKIRGTKPDKIPELRELLAKFMLRRTRKDVAPEMPEIAFEFMEIDAVDNGYLSEGTMSDDELIDAAQRYSTDIDDRISVAMSKAETLAQELVDTIGDGLLKQTVVFGWHRAPLERLCDILHEAGINAALINGGTTPKMREYIQRRFREGELQVVAANIQAAGTAIDLSAASHGYFLELWWVGADNLQAANRLVSLQKNEPVTFDICTAPGTVDDRVQRVLARRMKEIRELGLA